MRALVAACSFVLIVACDLPRDPEGTLQRVRGGTIRIGVAEHDPWVVLDESGEPTGGVEVDLVEEFAASIDADIEWFDGQSEELIGSLHTRSLDLVIAGLNSKSPFSKDATFTHPYITTFTTIGIPLEADVGEDLSGTEVAVEAGSELEGLVRKLDVVVQVVDDVTMVEGAVVTDDWLLDDLGLKASDVRLTETDHVMAVPHGENAWLTALERFLLARADRARELLEEDAP
ncbi:MAG: transporter substrate-binding domain-containing protein [Actinomycetota bacterium]|nr:transporter substrate-binding domain-containing protein [Actinomycetota bacterium]